MTIHSTDPFADPERDPVRRFRGRLGGVVSLWTTGETDRRAGLTVSSYLLANGDPAHALGLVDPDSDLAERVRETGTVVVQLLEWPHRDLAEAFAGLLPAPGGAFRFGDWEQTEWGPVLTSASAWVGARLSRRTPEEVGWSLLLDAVIENVSIGESTAPLVHRRGRYVRPEERP
jgi:flavin reductase (DIM6/NTAB) family NADH-FMN oxidoreductase RutF